jgi:hypothetical protein
MLLGRVLVALATAGICGFIAEGIYGESLNSVVMPVVVCFILAFMVASMFMVVVETTVDTIFICFLIDESLNSMYMSLPIIFGKMIILIGCYVPSLLYANDNRGYSTILW